MRSSFNLRFVTLDGVTEVMNALVARMPSFGARIFLKDMELGSLSRAPVSLFLDMLMLSC